MFGTVDSRRPQKLPGLEGMLGLFINTVPTRVQVEEELIVSEWLTQLQSQLMEVRDFAFSPLGEIQRASELLPAQALFESLLVVENFSVEDSLLQTSEDLGIREARLVARTHSPLSIVVDSSAARIALGLRYGRDRFQAVVMGRMLGHLISLLERLAEAPRETVGSLSLLSEEETWQLVKLWGIAPSEVGEVAWVQEAFARWARVQPAALSYPWTQSFRRCDV